MMNKRKTMTLIVDPALITDECRSLQYEQIFKW